MEEFKKYSHLMIDLETLGKTCDSVILSIGAVCFSMDGTVGDELELFPNVDDQIKIRKIEWSSIQWWFKQEADARLAIADAVRVSDLKNCLQTLDIFCEEHLTENFKVWGNGFDIPLLNHAYAQFSLNTPWSYKNILDCRTMTWLSKISTRNYSDNNDIKHSAISDAKFQIRFIVDAYKVIKL